MNKALCNIFAASFLIFATPAVAAHRGNPTVASAPVLQNITVNIGALTAAQEGGVPWDNLFPGNTDPVQTYNVTQTSGTVGDWQTGCDLAASPTTNHALSGTVYNQPNSCTLQTPLLYVGNPGMNYQANDVLPLSNGLCVIVQVGTDGATNVSGEIVSYALTGGFTATQSAEGIGNTTIVSSFSGCTSTAHGTGGTFTAVYVAKALTFFPTVSGETASPLPLHYVKTTNGVPNSSCNTTQTCTANLGPVTFSVTGTDAAGHTSAAVTVTLNLVPDAVSTADLNYGPNNPFGPIQDTSPIFRGSLQNFRNATLNCTTGGSSTCDWGVLISTGAQMHNPNGDNQNGICCGAPDTFGLFQVNAAAATVTAGGTPSVNDTLIIKDAARATGNVMYAANANHPAVNELDPSAGGVIGPAIFDQITASYGATSTTDACNTTSTSSAQNGVSLNGLEIGGTPKLNYFVNKVYQVNEASACNMWMTDLFISPQYVIDTNPADPLFGNFTYNAASGVTEGIETDGYSTNVNIDLLFVDGEANPWADGTSNPAQNGTVNIRNVVVRNAGTNSEGPGQATYKQQDIYVLGNVGMSLNALHPDIYQMNGTNYTPVGNTNKRTWFLAGNSNVTTNGLYFDGCDGGGPQGITFDAGVITVNALSGITMFCNDSFTNGASSFSAITFMRDVTNNPATNVSANYWSVLGTNSGMVNPTDGQVMYINVGCMPNATTCNQSTAASGAPTYAITFKNSPTGLQIQIGSSLAQTMNNFAAAVGLTPQEGSCAGAPVTALDTAYTAFSVANGGSGQRLCSGVFDSTGAGRIFMSGNASDGYVYYLLGCPYTPGSPSCTSGSNWLNTQFIGGSENDYFANLPPLWQNGVTTPTGPDISLGETASQANSCGLTTFTGTISGTTLTVSGVTGTVKIGQTIQQYVSGSPPNVVWGGAVAANTNITAGSGTSWTVNNSQSVGPITMGTFVSYCSDATHQMSFHNILDWGGVGGVAYGGNTDVNWYTLGNVQSNIGPGFNFANDNVILGNHCTGPGSTGCTGTSTGIFTSDGGTTAPAELLAVPFLQKIIMNSKQECLLYLGPVGTQTIGGVSVPTGILAPKTGGVADPSRSGSTGLWAGGITGDSTPVANDGSSVVPCNDLNNNYHPYYYKTLAGG